jgi:hypothetical protein
MAPPFATRKDFGDWWSAATPAARDALVAEKVMGWQDWASPCVGPLGGPDCWLTPDAASPTLRKDGWRPSADIANAWEVGRNACARGRRTADRFATALLTEDTRPDCFTDACESVAWLFAQDDLPERICKAALLALPLIPEGDPTP